MADRVTGVKRLPSVPGVVAALDAYGMTATVVAVGIAQPDPGASTSGQMKQAHLENQTYAARVQRDPRGQVLPGKLVMRNGVMEEKITDVACATEVCRQAHLIVTGATPEQAIVVLSEDIDISPAFRFAEELRVPIYAAAHDTVHSRPGDWLLLGEPAFVKMCGKPAGMPRIGAALRADVAQRVAGSVTLPAGTWTVRYLDSARGQVVLRDPQGMTGVIDKGSIGHVKSGMPVNIPLTAVGVSFGGPRSSDFPQVILAPSSVPPVGRCETAMVEARRDPTRIRVRFTSGPTAGSQQELQASIAQPMVGDVVLVHVETGTSARTRVRLVGTLTPGPAITSGPVDEPRLYTVISATSLGDAVALDEAGGKSVLKLPRGVSPTAGERFAGVIIDRLKSRSSTGAAVIAQAVSTKLP
jgi:hypothetical protein